MKIIKKAIRYILITAVILVSSAVIVTFVYKKEIINLLKLEVNKRIKTELKVNHIDLKMIKGFPNISVEFQGVQFYSAFEDELLLEAEHIYFVLNIIDLFSKNIVVERLEIIDAVINISVNRNGEKNFDVFVVSDSSETSIGSLNLKSIHLLNVEVNDTDAKNKIKDGYYIKSLIGGLQLNDKVLNLEVRSSFKLLRTLQPQLGWLINKNILLDTKNEIIGNDVNIYASSISIEKVKLNLEGSIRLDGNRAVDLLLSTSDLKLKDLRSILPKALQNKLVPYQGRGNINLSTKIKGRILEKKWPGIRAKITLNDFEIRHKELRSALKEVNLNGEITISNFYDLSTGEFLLTNLTGIVDDNKFEFTGKWKNFVSPTISGSVTGSIGVNWFLPLISSEQLGIKEARGIVKLDISGKVLLNKSFALTSSKIAGKINLSDISVDSLFGLPVTSLQGELIFDNQNIEVSVLSGGVGESNFRLSGVLTLPKENNNRIYSTLKVESDFINLNEIVSALTTSIDSSSSMPSLNFSARLELNTQRLDFLKFRGEDLSLNLTIDEKNITVNSSYAKGLGGEVALKGVMTEQFNGDHYFKVTTLTNNIDIDSLFYVFGNFGQSFITSEAIKGKLDANVYSHMYFDSNWNFKRQLLYSEASLKILEGELVNYTPVMSLAEYLNEEGEDLAQLKFSDIENHIIVANDTVFIEDMYVGTNVRNIKIGGYHTLNQHIDYRLAVPVISNKKDNDTKFGKVKKDDFGQLYFPFRVFGTTSDYKVSYDLKTASSNFIKGVGNVIVGNSVEDNVQDSLKIEDDEFFDWDDN